MDSAYPYDVKFNIAGDSTDYGFMLVSPTGQSKQIEVKEAGQPEELKRVNSSAIASYQDFASVVDTPFAMSDFSGGVGQLYFEEGSDNRIFWGVGITHVPGKLFKPPPVSTYSTASVTGDYTNWKTYVHTNGVRYNFMWESVNLWRRDTSSPSNNYVKVYTATDNITDFAIMDTVGFILTPTKTGTTDFVYQTDLSAAATWTPTAANHAPFSVNNKPSYFNVNKSTCYASVNSNLIYYTTDPTVDSWVGPIDVGTSGNISGKPGDETYQIKHMTSVNDFLMVFRDDEVLSIDSQQDVTESIWEWKEKPSINNFRHIGKAGQKLLFNIRSEVRYYDPITGTNREIGMAIQSGFSVKEVLGIDGDERYIYVLAKVRIPYIRSADSVALFRCYPGVDFEYAFEVLWEDEDLSTETYYGLFAEPSGYDTRLYWGKNASSGDSSVQSILLPAEWDASTGSSFTTSQCKIYTSITKSGFPGFDKRHLYTTVNGVGMSISNNNTVAYSTDNGTVFSNLGVMSSDTFEYAFVNTYSKSIMIRFTLDSDGTVTPIITSFAHHQRVRYKYLQSISMSVRVGDSEMGVELRNRTRKRMNPEEWVGWLNELRTTANEITYNDFMGNTFPVSVDMIFIRPTRHREFGLYELEAVVIATRSDDGN